MDGRVSYMAEGDYPHLTLLQPEAEADLPTYIDTMVESNPQELFFTKDWDWASETEYRLLLRGQTQDEEFLDVHEALEAVVIGPRLHPVYRPGLFKLTQELQIECLEIQWEMGPPVIVRMRDPDERRLTEPPS